MRFLDNKKAIMMATIVIIIVLLIGFIILSIIVFPSIWDGIKDVMGLASDCKDPGRTIDEYEKDIETGLEILQTIYIDNVITLDKEAWEQGNVEVKQDYINSPVEIRLNAEEYVIGIDRDLYACYKKGKINKSDFEAYENRLFGPEDGDYPPRRIEVIYRDYMRILSESCVGASLREIKSYVGDYVKRFPQGEFLKTVPGYINVYKKCKDVEKQSVILEKKFDAKYLKELFSATKQQLKITSAVEDPEFVYNSHDTARSNFYLFVFGTKEPSFPIGVHENQIELRQNISKEDLITVSKEYSRLFSEMYLKLLKEAIEGREDYGDSDEEKQYNDEDADYFKVKGGHDIFIFTLIANTFYYQGNIAAYDAMCSATGKVGNDVLRFFNQTRICTPKEALKSRCDSCSKSCSGEIDKSKYCLTNIGTISSDFFCCA